MLSCGKIGGTLSRRSHDVQGCKERLRTQSLKTWLSGADCQGEFIDTDFLGNSWLVIYIPCVTPSYFHPCDTETKVR